MPSPPPAPLPGCLQGSNPRQVDLRKILAVHDTASQEDRCSVQFSERGKQHRVLPSPSTQPDLRYSAVLLPAEFGLTQSLYSRVPAEVRRVNYLPGYRRREVRRRQVCQLALRQAPLSSLRV